MAAQFAVFTTSTSMSMARVLAHGLEHDDRHCVGDGMKPT
jgi:hypothetical protein